MDNAISFSKTILSVTGIYSKNKDGKVDYIDYVKRFMIFIIYATTCGPWLAFLIKNMNRTEDIVETLYYFTCSILILVRIITYTVRHNSLLILERSLTADIFKDINKKQMQLMKKANQTIERIFKIYRIVIIQGITLYFIVHLIFGRGQKFKLPLETVPPFVAHNYFTFIILYIYQVLFVVVQVHFLMANDHLFITYSYFIYTILRVLKTDLRKTDYSQSTPKVMKQLRKNIAFHKTILRITQELEHISSIGNLCQLLISIGLISFSVFYFMADTSMKKRHISQSILYYYMNSFYCVMALMQIGIYCCCGDMVYSESDDLNKALYLSNWYTISDKSIRKDLIIFGERLKRPIILTGGKMIPLTIPTLISIVKSAYSFMAVLQNTS